MSHSTAAFRKLIEKCLSILIENPGKALQISSRFYAVQNDQGQVAALTANLSGQPNIGSMFNILDIAKISATEAKINAFADEAIRRLENPILFPFKEAHGFFVDWSGRTQKVEAPTVGYTCDVYLDGSRIELIDREGFVIHQATHWTTIEAMEAAGVTFDPAWLPKPPKGKVAEMSHEKILEVLAANENPENRVLLDDGLFFIQQLLRDPKSEGFLFLRCPVTHATPHGTDCIGKYNRTEKGVWVVHTFCAPSEVQQLDSHSPEFGTRNGAVAALWMDRLTVQSRLKNFD